MNQNLQNIARVYDSVAEAYADHFSGEHEKKPMDREILGLFVREVGGNQPVWDFGCGPGHTTCYLQTLGLEISGLDLSPKILDQARTLYPEIPFRQGNLLDLDFEDDTIAAVVSFYAIVHFTQDQVEKAFLEIFRVLKPGGLYLFTFHVGDETIGIDEFLGQSVEINFMLFTTEFIRDSLRRNGFISIELFQRVPYPDVEYQSNRGYVFARKPI